MLFAELTYTLATEEAERIGVDHVARMTATGTGENSTGKLSLLLWKLKLLVSTSAWKCFTCHVTTLWGNQITLVCLFYQPILCISKKLDKHSHECLSFHVRSRNVM